MTDWKPLVAFVVSVSTLPLSAKFLLTAFQEVTDD